MQSYCPQAIFERLDTVGFRQKYDSSPKKLHFFPNFNAEHCVHTKAVSSKVIWEFLQKPPRTSENPKTTKSFSLLALTFVQSFQTVGYVFHVPNPEQNKDAAGCYVKNKFFFFLDKL